MQMTHLFYLKPRADNVVNHLNGTNKNKQRRRQRWCPRNNVKPRCYLLRAVRKGWCRAVCIHRIMLHAHRCARNKFITSKTNSSSRENNVMYIAYVYICVCRIFNNM